MVTMRCSRQQFVVCLISASAISVFSLVTQFLVLFQSNSYTIKKRCSGYESSELSNKIQHRTFNKVTYKDYLDRPSSDLTRLQNEWRIDATLFHNFPKEKRYLTIGIPTIKRVGDEYIMDTINSLVNNTRPEQLKDIYIVIFLADFNETWREDISGRLNESYPQLISSETLVVISSWKSFYPSLENLNHTYNDNYNKRKWRSKQNTYCNLTCLMRTVNRLCTTESSDKIQRGTSNKVTYKDYLDRPSSDLTSLQNEWKVDATLFHKFPKEKRFLTLGIPTIRRVGDEYIMDTIKSLVNNTRPEELKDLYIVIFLADFNETWIDDISKRLNKSYPQLISLETLVVIRSWKSFYPSLENLNHTYNDKYEK
eukprot:XP_019919910.1 PREDICTED: alpha-1,3-mannosyl-glycoprotein 4-beta-N-acetylglucosaminyltransferase C-like [Crassostrea gigas]